LGIYAEYLSTISDFDQITKERKKQLNRISEIRDRDILVYTADHTRNEARISIDYSDILPFEDQLANLSRNKIDIILETPGGLAEVVEDIVRTTRNKYDSVGIIVPGWAKSAGTIFTMAGDEILMGPSSALGPIDAQILSGGKRYSADAFLEGLEKIKADIESTGRLNPMYIPILQNISPGEIQRCENAQNFSKVLVTNWLKNYKFKFWDKHSNGNIVTDEERHNRAEEIAKEICSQSKWLTHYRSISLSDLTKIGLKVTDYSQDNDLYDAISRYYTLMRMTFESTNIYKIFETTSSQIYRFIANATNPPPNTSKRKNIKTAELDYECPNCKNKFLIQANLEKNMALKPGLIPYPISDNMFVCPKCNLKNNLSSVRLNIEATLGRRFV
jgi:hypothetical protein